MVLTATALAAAIGLVFVGHYLRARTGSIDNVHAVS